MVRPCSAALLLSMRVDVLHLLQPLPFRSAVEQPGTLVAPWSTVFHIVQDMGALSGVGMYESCSKGVIERLCMLQVMRRCSTALLSPCMC